MSSTLVIAPHADDETLGCGGTILKMRREGVRLGWLLVTSPSVEHGYPEDFVRRRVSEIQAVTQRYGFDFVKILDFPPGGIAEASRKTLVGRLSDAMNEFAPQTVFLPHGGDVHSDHRIIFEACQSALKTFRAPQAERILCYETLSETEQGFAPSFLPNVFVDISGFLEGKLGVIELYASETATFPFPRSRFALESLARYRGAQAGFQAAEAFMLMRERIF